MFVAALATTATRLRATLLPGWAGAEARLAELVLGTASAVVLLELLGLVGLLQRPALLGAAVLTALATRALKPAVVAPPPPAAARTPRALLALAAGSVAVVTAQWVTSVRATSRTGIEGVDALHYHLTYAAHFVRDGSLLHLQRLDLTGVATWYPLNDELLHSAGMLLLGTDALSLVLGLTSLVAVLLAAWCLAAPHSAGPAAVVGTCVLLVVVGPDYAASASNDWSATWPLVAALALVLQSRRRTPVLPLPAVALTGLAGGLAIGTKLTVLAPAVALLVVVLVLSRDRWRPALAVTLCAHLLTGGLWYVRNLVVVGNPVPVADLKVLPRPDLADLDRVSFSVLHYATDTRVLSDWFRPALRTVFGPAWPVLLLLVAAGLVLGALRAKDGLVRGAAVVGLASAATYLVTPTGAGGLEGKPYLFGYNLRYALVALLLGLLLLAVVGAGRAGPVTVALAALLGVTVLHKASWVEGWPGQAAATTAAVLAVGAAVLLAGRRVRVVGAGVLVVAMLAGAAPVERHYTRQRYAGDGPADRLFAAVDGVTGARVGVVGFPLEYPYFGPRWQNEVVYLGQRGPGQSFADFTDCRAFRTSVRERHVDWVAVHLQQGVAEPPALAWTRSDPAARVVASSSAGTVFHLSGALDPGTCP